MSKQTVGDNDGHEHFDENRHSNNQSNHSTIARPTTRYTSDEVDSEDEIGAWIYQRSRTAKARAAVSGKAKAKHTIPNEESEYASPLKNKQSRGRRVCSREGCTNLAIRGGVCVRHGAKRKECSHDGCTNQSRKEGICVRHGAKRKECSYDGCTKGSYRGGVCFRHGPNRKICSHEGCTNVAIKGGVCIRHGAKVKRCSYKGCTQRSIKGGVCARHGARKECSYEGCTNRSVTRGVCIRHGVKRRESRYTTPSEEDSAGDMGHSARNAATKDALTNLIGEVSVLGMGQR